MIQVFVYKDLCIKIHCFREEWIEAIRSISDNLKVTEETGPEPMLGFKNKKKVVSFSSDTL